MIYILYYTWLNKKNFLIFALSFFMNIFFFFFFNISIHILLRRKIYISRFVIEVFFLLFVKIILNDEEKRLKNRRYKVYRFKISFRWEISTKNEVIRNYFIVIYLVVYSILDQARFLEVVQQVKADKAAPFLTVF